MDSFRDRKSPKMVVFILAMFLRSQSYAFDVSGCRLTAEFHLKKKGKLLRNLEFSLKGREKKGTIA